jgi:hypothetical protein
MTKYRIHVVNEDGHVAGHKDVSRANDEEARLAAKHEVTPDGQAEVWAGERCVGQVVGDVGPPSGGSAPGETPT